MSRKLILAAGLILVFMIVAFILLRVMPGPLGQLDYLVIGVIATLICMLLLFLVLINTTMRDSETFFKRRR